MDEQPFVEVALKVFNYQALNNPVYGKYLEHLQVHPAEIQRLEDIPCLPISLFKYHSVVTDQFTPEKVFMSSGTTQKLRSKHLVRDLNFYLSTAQHIFESVYGPLEQFNLIALLPNYLEQGQSSLIAMIDHFIKATNSPHSGFYLDQLKITTG